MVNENKTKLYILFIFFNLIKTKNMKKENDVLLMAGIALVVFSVTLIVINNILTLMLQINSIYLILFIGAGCLLIGTYFPLLKKKIYNINDIKNGTQIVILLISSVESNSSRNYMNSIILINKKRYIFRLSGEDFFKPKQIKKYACFVKIGEKLCRTTEKNLKLLTINN